MRVAHHFAMAPPPDARREAVLQEASWLRAEFPGPSSFLLPDRRLHGLLPAAWPGPGWRRRLRRLDAEVEVHHLWADRLDWLRRFAALAKPLVCTLTTGLEPEDVRRPAGLPPVAALLVADEAQRALLAARGLGAIHVVPPAAELSGIERRPAPRRPPLVLLAGSAPWTRRQFRTKGTDLLLATAAERGDLELTLLWRGVLAGAIDRRLRRARLGGRARVVHERAAVGPLLAASHAAVVLAARPRLVKAYPPSLLESLAAGRPILASSCLPIAGWAARERCGVAVAELSAAALRAALAELEARYGELEEGARRLDLSPHSPTRHRQAVGAIYRSVVERGR